MDVANLLMRAMLVDNGTVYAPYSFEGVFASDEDRVIRDAITSHVPIKVDALFNNWCFAKYGDRFFSARRATWTEGSLIADSAEGLQPVAGASTHHRVPRNVGLPSPWLLLLNEHDPAWLTTSRPTGISRTTLRGSQHNANRPARRM